VAALTTTHISGPVLFMAVLFLAWFVLGVWLRK
jgi:hypothetical protein